MSRDLSSRLAGILVSLLLFSLLLPRVMAQASVQGQWSTQSNTMPINPVHVALLGSGKVLVVAGSGNCPPSQSGCPSGPPYGPSNNSGALLWDPATGTIAQFSLSWDMFCNGMVLLSDGRALIDGGTTQYDPFHGQAQAALFDPATNTFTNAPKMAHGRWYPTVVTLGDGRVMTFSGLDENGNTNANVEFYTIGSGWSQQYPANWTPDLYPRLHLLPNGNVFFSGAQTTSKMFDPSSTSWNTNFASTNYSGNRTYGTSVLLPLTPANNYNPKVIIMGGGNPATNTTETIDMGASTPVWHYGPNMSKARIEMNAVILPNGKVLALGGSVNDEDTSTLSLSADLYDPATNTFSSAGANASERLYHSVALLLPDATVWVAGGNPSRGTYNNTIEIYQPSYLFNSDGTMATRPSITSAPSSISYGNSFSVTTPDAANISSVVLVRNGTVTHAFGMDQREVGLSFTAGSGTLSVTAPPNGNTAPPGYYMMFILNSSGVPSLASFVQLGQQPDFSIAVSPSAQSVVAGSSTRYTMNVTAMGGFNGTVSFAVTGLPPNATASFSPTTVTGSGSSTLTVTTANSTPAGVSNLTITGTAGTLSHQTTATLTVSTPGTPTVTSVSPNNGSIFGGTQITIRGTNFASGATVTLGGTAATNVVVVSASQITATTGAHAAGVVNVVVANSNGQGGSLSNAYTYSSTAAIGFVQVAAATPTSAQVLSVTFPGAQTAGNLNIVVVGWADTTSTVSSVVDSQGNAYSRAVGPTSGNGVQQSIYYAKNIVAGGNTVTVTFNKVASYPDVRILEYDGLDANGPLDATAGAVGNSSSASSGPATTTSSNELIFGAGTTAGGFSGPGAGFTVRLITSDVDIAEDKVVSTNGSYSAVAPLDGAAWVMQMATFKAASVLPAPTVTGVSPSSGPAAGGTAIMINGTNFATGATVTLGGTGATNVVVVNASQITATTAAHAAGAVNVVVTNSDGESGTLTNGYTYTNSVAISFGQVGATVLSGASQVTVVYPAAQTLGDLNVVVVGWNDTTATVQSVTDSNNNTYSLAIGPTSGTGLRQSIYNAPNIKGGSNTVTVTFNQTAQFPDVRILEYRGVGTLDVTAGSKGSSGTATSGAASTTAANELIFGAATTVQAVSGAGSGFTSRIITSYGDNAEDRVVTTAGSYSATAPIRPSGAWVMQMVTFK